MYYSRQVNDKIVNESVVSYYNIVNESVAVITIVNESVVSYYNIVIKSMATITKKECKGRGLNS